MYLYIMESQGLNYYQRNKEKILERQKKYNKEHQQECIERNKNITTMIIFGDIITRKRLLIYHQPKKIILIINFY